MFTWIVNSCLVQCATKCLQHFILDYIHNAKGLDSFIDFVEWLQHNANIKDKIFHLNVILLSKCIF